MRQLEVLVRDRRFRPRWGVDVEVRVEGDVQRAVTGEDGVARFEVPDIAPVRIVVGGVEEEIAARDVYGPVRRVSIVQ